MRTNWLAVILITWLFSGFGLAQFRLNQINQTDELAQLRAFADGEESTPLQKAQCWLLLGELESAETEMIRAIKAPNADYPVIRKLMRRWIVLGEFESGKRILEALEKSSPEPAIERYQPYQTIPYFAKHHLVE